MSTSEKTSPASPLHPKPQTITLKPKKRKLTLNTKKQKTNKITQT